MADLHWAKVELKSFDVLKVAGWEQLPPAHQEFWRTLILAMQADNALFEVEFNRRLAALPDSQRPAFIEEQLFGEFERRGKWLVDAAINGTAGPIHPACSGALDDLAKNVFCVFKNFFPASEWDTESSIPGDDGSMAKGVAVMRQNALGHLARFRKRLQDRQHSLLADAAYAKAKKETKKFLADSENVFSAANLDFSFEESEEWQKTSKEFQLIRLDIKSQLNSMKGDLDARLSATPRQEWPNVAEQFFYRRFEIPSRAFMRAAMDSPFGQIAKQYRTFLDSCAEQARSDFEKWLLTNCNECDGVTIRDLASKFTAKLGAGIFALLGEAEAAKLKQDAETLKAAEAKGTDSARELQGSKGKQKRSGPNTRRTNFKRAKMDKLIFECRKNAQMGYEQTCERLMSDGIERPSGAHWNTAETNRTWVQAWLDPRYKGSIKTLFDKAVKRASKSLPQLP